MDKLVGTAVQFGAGNIGRGFIAELFNASGLEVVFIDIARGVVDALNERGAYTISIVGPGAREVRIDHVRAIDARNEDAVAAEVASCAVACTAVGAAAMPRVAPLLAEGLAHRRRQGGGPLNVLVCENLHDAAGALREMVAQFVPAAERDDVMTSAGFVQAVVSRMVPLHDTLGADPLGIRVEAYRRLPVDAAAIVGALPPVADVEPVQDFAAQVERKLYAHNAGHAALGYLGWRAGHTYGWQALEDPAVRREVHALMSETGEALVRRHGFDRADYAAHVEDLLTRFANRDLGDTCFRLARDPLRKLAPHDRLVGAARMCEAESVVTRALPSVIAAALRFDAPDDRSAVKLQEMIAAEGIESALRAVCAVDPKEPLGSAVLSCYAQ